MKFILAILLAVASLSSLADQLPPMPIQSCIAQIPQGLPSDKVRNATMVCRHAYVVHHDNVAKIPVWVAYTLTPAHAVGCASRSHFSPDYSIPSGDRAELEDYAGSGYDTGHIANDADMTWSDISEIESMILSNMAPQLAGFNRGGWKKLETVIRAWAYERGHPLTIYAGPIYNVAKDKTIGPNRVVIPDAFFKIVIDDTTGETLAFVMPHKRLVKVNLDQFTTTVTDIEKQTGIVFPLSPATKSIKADSVWPYSTKQAASHKKNVCSIQ